MVQVNEWGTSHIDEEDVATIRSFVEAGGGLLIAGSALHWKWWLSWTAAVNQGDAILEGSGTSGGRTTSRRPIGRSLPTMRWALPLRCGAVMSTRIRSTLCTMRACSRSSTPQQMTSAMWSSTSPCGA